MLILDAEIDSSTLTDVRFENGVVTAIAPGLQRQDGEPRIDAGGCALLPGLHDHHLHFLSYAASLVSVTCGPPQVRTEADLIDVLKKSAREIGAKQGSWLRGIGYHASVAGEIDRHWLDRCVSHIPVRIQHRSGRLWILNSRALDLLGDLNDSPLEKRGGEFTGRLYDADTWLRQRAGSTAIDVRTASRQLASYGITSFTDTTPRNTMATAEHFAQLQQRDELLQDVTLMGDAGLDLMSATPRLRRGAHKVHLHENDLPEIESLCGSIRNSHAAGRPVAVHCVTLTELIFTLNAFAQAGTVAGDRIEHAAVAPPEAMQQLAELKLRVVTQPNFIAERGDAYLQEVEAADVPWLYRLRGFMNAGIALAAGTDAPFGNANPWLAMQAAVTRRTRGGNVVGAAEALSPESALRLFGGDPMLPGEGESRIAIGAPANFLLLTQPWSEAREELADVRVVATIRDGEVIWSA
jgi:predicted amidohydrolase YtcJ